MRYTLKIELLRFWACSFQLCIEKSVLWNKFHVQYEHVRLQIRRKNLDLPLILPTPPTPPAPSYPSLFWPVCLHRSFSFFVLHPFIIWKSSYCLTFSLINKFVTVVWYDSYNKTFALLSFLQPYVAVVVFFAQCLDSKLKRTCVHYACNTHLWVTHRFMH